MLISYWNKVIIWKTQTILNLVEKNVYDICKLIILFIKNGFSTPNINYIIHLLSEIIILKKKFEKEIPYIMCCLKQYSL